MAKYSKQYRIFEHIGDVDISEQDIWDYDEDVLRKLLIDHTMSDEARRKANDPSQTANIFWATGDYEAQKEAKAKEEGKTPDEVETEKNGFRYADQILPENIIGTNGRIIMPRVLKDKQLQVDRTKDKAEVFTPSWVCNAQNNLIDEAWFGRKDVFNTEETLEDGTHTWTPTLGKIVFPEDDKQKTWKKYVTDNRMEITCGEAPYLVSRYDTTTGEPIPISRRIGLLDRKLRVINENVEDEKEWYTMAAKAYQHTYGYEWQGDNLLLAREALLYTYIEYYIEKFNKKDADGNIILENVPDKNKLKNIARFISWNLWQMDGIKMVVPDSCDNQFTEPDLFGLSEKMECPACKKGETLGHIGTYCKIRDWNMKKPAGYTCQPWEDPKSSPWQKFRFVKLLNSNGKQTDDDEDFDEELEAED